MSTVRKAVRAKSVTYILHVIGTVTMWHVEMALQSLNRQAPFYWKRFVLFNASDLDSMEIMSKVPRTFFEEVGVHVNPRSKAFASCSADWHEQMTDIDGTDRYFVHKVDFYLPPWTCREFERIPKLRGDFIVMFNKWDMKSRATAQDIYHFANMTWKQGLLDPDAGVYTEHLGKLAISFEQKLGQMDGVMHGYTDGVRKLYQPTLAEITSRWGVAVWFRKLDEVHPKLVIRDKKFFACHIWHDSPDRTDWNKLMSDDERF
jgi:hypothetical protein